VRFVDLVRDIGLMKQDVAQVKSVLNLALRDVDRLARELEKVREEMTLRADEEERRPSI